MDANINIVFTGGVGSLTIKLVRGDGTTDSRIVTQTNPVPITFTNVQSNDSISMLGTCTGTTTIKIDIPTIPSTPYNYPAGKIDVLFLI